MPFKHAEHAQGPWSQQRKWVYTIIVVSLPAIIGFSSSVQTPALSTIAADFKVSRELAAVSASTYLVGFGLGPFVFAPLSEVFGRNIVYYSTFSCFCLWNLPCALSPNISALLVFRFAAGFFGSPAVANSGGSLTDLWTPDQRSVPFALFISASFCGPVVAPIVGGFLTQYVTWQWNFWFVLITSGVLLGLLVVILPETYPTKRQKCKEDTISTSPRTRPDTTNILAQIRTGLARPWLMLFKEPILFCFSLYMAFIYGILYLNFTIYPSIFQGSRHWSLSISGLAFLGIGVGMAIATAIFPLLAKLHARHFDKMGPVPEARLPHLIIVSWFMPVGLFIFAWTAEPPIHWAVPILAGLPFGFSLVMLFLGINSYLTECYERFSASALAANAALRCAFGAGFAVFADGMYARLGTAWATSLLGFIAMALTPMPWVFYKYGPYLRSKSKYHLLATGRLAEHVNAVPLVDVGSNP